MKLFISGYGGGESNSIGLYDVGVDCRKKELLWASNVEASSYLSYHDNLLFGITEKGSGCWVYMFIGKGDGYSLVDSRELNSDILCHISYLPKSRALVGSCYGSGEVFSIGVGDQGFKELLCTLRQGDRDDIESRAHCGVPDAEEKRLYSANIALDRIYIYDINKGMLSEREYFQLNRGEGPRHIALYPELDLIYIITEYSNRIITIHMGKEGLKIVQSINTLPEGFQGQSYCSTLCLTKDKKYLYAANRGSNTIGIFKVRDDGLLEKISHSDCFGNWPRHIDLIGGDNYIAITNERSDQVVIVQRDSETGQIKDVVNRIDFKRPGFVVEKL